jgi:uncharacterized protein (TIGR03083 family)
MTTGSQQPEGPGGLRMRTDGDCEIAAARLLDVFERQRRRFIAELRGFGPDDWAGPTRCADWSAHEVVRHLCDANVVAVVPAGDRTLDVRSGFDPRVTPAKWPSFAADQLPADTLACFTQTTEDLLGLARDRLARGESFAVWLPYGPMDWTILILHAAWDSWLHERDILLPRGAEPHADDDAIFYATAYGLFIATAVASMSGWQGRAELSLSGSGGGTFALASREAVTLTAARGHGAGPDAAQTADALGGRAAVAAALAELPSDSRQALLRLANFFNLPAAGRTRVQAE